MSEKLPHSAKSIAYFVTDHGYGHATRAAAVMTAVARAVPGACFEVFTTAPQWLFEDQRGFRYRYHRLKTDVGLIQSTPLEVDLDATKAELSRFLPFEADTVAKTASYLRKIDCRMVICDIAPIGLSVAARAGIPSALVENFTWDWIYAGYHDRHPGLERFSEYLGEVFASARIRFQAEPFCHPAATGLKTNPVCRAISADRSHIRASLGISASQQMVLLSMGGFANPQNFQPNLPDVNDVVFVIPGGSETVVRRNNAVLTPPHQGCPHQDLVNAADAVIGKVGYSTLAEVYHAGVAYGYLARNDFRESAVLVDFIERHIPSIAIDQIGSAAGSWQAELSTLLSLPRVNRNRVNGAQQVARHLASCL